MSSARKLVNAVTGMPRFLRTYGQHLPMAFEAIFSVPCGVTGLRGTLRDGGEPATVAYVGRGLNYQYILRLLFDAYEVVEQADTTLFNYRKHLERLAREADLVISDIGWPYHGMVNRHGDFLEMPDWVNLSLDLADDWTSVVRGFRHTTRNNDLRLVRRNAYHCKPTNDRDVIERFYDEMYAPFVTRRHEEESVLAPREQVVGRAMSGALLRVFREQQVVAAGVVYPEGEVLYFLWMGVPVQFGDSPPEGAISALYYYGIRHAFDTGLKTVDFTGTRAVLNDGPFRFKRKWGAVVDDAFSPSSILVRPRNGSLAAARFCQRNPLLARRDGGLEALILSDGEPVDEGRLRQLDKEFGCAGIDRMTVIDLCGGDSSGVGRQGKDGRGFRHVRATLQDFADHYRRQAAAGT